VVVIAGRGLAIINHAIIVVVPVIMPGVRVILVEPFVGGFVGAMPVPVFPAVPESFRVSFRVVVVELVVEPLMVQMVQFMTKIAVIVVVS
jgi:hypothetical protein